MMFGCNGNIFEAMCKFLNDIDEADTRYLKLVSIVELNIFGDKDDFFYFAVVLNLILLYIIGT